MPVKTKLTELPDSRVRVEAEVGSEDVEASLERTARALGRDMRIPGFRKGKVPAKMVIQRVGREALMEQAVRDSLPRWYEQAILQADVSTVGDPKLDIGDLPAAGEPLSFSIEVAVTPRSRLGEYKGIEVGRREPDVPAEAVDQEVERLRESLGRVESVDRPLAEGDYAVVDFVGKVGGEPFEGGEARDYMLEIGGGRLIEGFEEQLLGARGGETRAVEVRFPDEYPAEELRGKDATFDVDVKDVKEKELPALDDDFASEASEFDSLAELRSDIEEKLAEAQRRSIEEEFREAVVDAAAAQAQIELPDDLVAARAEEMWERTAHALSHQNVDADAYLKAAGRTREEVIEDAKPDAARQLARESVLEAVAEEEDLEATDEDVVDALRRSAEREGTTPEKLLELLRKNGRDAAIRHDLRLRKAADLLAEHAKPIAMEKAAAREKLWTPGKEREAGERQLWTPGADPET